MLGVTALAACGSSSSGEPDFGPEPAAAQGDDPAAASAQLPDTAVNPRLLRRFRPLRATLDDRGAPRSTALVELGRMLFFDPRLSRNGGQSCNSCHSLEQHGVDHLPTSRGARGMRGQRNSPSVYHAAGHFTGFWDGRAATVEEQAGAPILNPDEMGMKDRESVVAMLQSIPGYATAFAAAFPDEAPSITFDNVGRAIDAFERGLVTPSRWDRYLEGATTALSTNEIKGLKLFASLGCITCHTGEMLGGSSFQKVGVVAPWPNQADQGRFQITKLDDDRMTFKVPSLRNVAVTAPYFHDGSVPDLSTAVRMMASYQLGAELDATSIAELVAWLQSLTGSLPTEYISPPRLPPNGTTTLSLARR